MKKIYLVYGYYGIGGAQRRAAILANEFVKSGYDITILSLFGSNGSISNQDYYHLHHSIDLVLLPEWIAKMKENVKVKSSIKSSERKEKKLKKEQHLFNTLGKSSKRLIKRLRVVRSTRLLDAYYQLNEPGIVICFGFNVFEQVFHATHKNSKVIYAETNAINKYMHDNNFSETLLLIKKADVRIFQTNRQKQDLGIEEDHTYIIHNPINQSLPEPYFGERNNIIVNFCALKRHKNLILLIKAFDQLRSCSSDYSSYRLFLYSDNPDEKDNDYRDEIIQCIKSHDLDDNVKLLPMVPDVHQRIRNCRMFVSSSDYEGISNSMIEAMAIGLPCVCTDCDGGGAREFIVNGYNGLLVEPNNQDALFASMKQMVDDYELSAKCSSNAMIIREELSVEHIVCDWLSIINNLGRD